MLQMNMAVVPNYRLDEIWAKIDEGKVFFSHNQARSIKAVILVYSCAPGNSVKSFAEAERFILDELKRLKNVDFYSTGYQNFICTDIYGKVIDGKPWFIKFGIDDDDLDLISFHPPKDSMLLQSGVTIPKGA